MKLIPNTRYISNEIIDNDSLNVLDVENIYNGAGVNW
jgi:hypothetical protein